MGAAAGQACYCCRGRWGQSAAWPALHGWECLAGQQGGWAACKGKEKELHHAAHKALQNVGRSQSFSQQHDQYNQRR